jgi:hypothetical protein
VNLDKIWLTVDTTSSQPTPRKGRDQNEETAEMPSGIHAWETRENPDTRERYEVCMRCDTYRDPGQAAPGAGAAGVTGMGFG